MKSFKQFLPESFLTELTDGPSDSASPVNGGEANGKPNPAKTISGVRELHRGDPVKIIGQVASKGQKGFVSDFPTRDGDDEKSFVVVDFGTDLGKKSFHCSDVEYDDDTDSEEDEEVSYRHAIENLKTLSGY